MPFSCIKAITGSSSGKLTAPTITIESGVLKFDCGTNDAEYRYSITYPESNENMTGNNVLMPTSFTVSVFAVKSGYEKSDIATKEFTIVNGVKGDLTGEGEVNVADHVELSKIILNQK